MDFNKTWWVLRFKLLREIVRNKTFSNPVSPSMRRIVAEEKIPPIDRRKGPAINFDPLRRIWQRKNLRNPSRTRQKEDAVEDNVWRGGVQWGSVNWNGHFVGHCNSWCGKSRHGKIIRVSREGNCRGLNAIIRGTNHRTRNRFRGTGEPTVSQKQIEKDM